MILGLSGKKLISCNEGHRVACLHRTAIVSHVHEFPPIFAKAVRETLSKVHAVAQGLRTKATTQRTARLATYLEHNQNFQTLATATIPIIKQTSWMIPEPTTIHQWWRKCCKTSPQTHMLHRASFLPLEATQIPPSDFPTT